MKNTAKIAFSGLLALSMIACKDNKPTDVIITKKVPEQKKSTAPQQMSDYSWNKTVDWVGSHYTIFITRKADKDLPMVKDEAGNSYYDNRISLKVVRQDGSVFFEHTFQKDEFKSFTNNAYGKDGALLGLAFDRTEEDYLVFGASVGSPDTMSDEYIPLVVTVSRFGDIGIKSDTQLDTGSERATDEIEAAEAEGM